LIEFNDGFHTWYSLVWVGGLPDGFSFGILFFRKCTGVFSVGMWLLKRRRDDVVGVTGTVASSHAQSLPYI
jgi:hypothetical protein